MESISTRFAMALAAASVALALCSPLALAAEPAADAPAAPAKHAQPAAAAVPAESAAGASAEGALAAAPPVSVQASAAAAAEQPAVAREGAAGQAVGQPAGQDAGLAVPEEPSERAGAATEAPAEASVPESLKAQAPAAAPEQAADEAARVAQTPAKQAPAAQKQPEAAPRPAAKAKAQADEKTATQAAAKAATQAAAKAKAQTAAKTTAQPAAKAAAKTAQPAGQATAKGTAPAAAKAPAKAGAASAKQAQGVGAQASKAAAKTVSPQAKPASAKKPAAAAAPAKQQPAKAKAPAKAVAAQAAPAQPLANGLYYIESAKNLKLVVDMSGESKANGGNAIVWDYSGNANQRWKLSFDKASGCYFIANANSGKLLSLAGGKAANGANAVQWAKKSGNAKTQLWKIAYDAKRGCTISSGARLDLLLSIQGGKAAKGDNVQVAAAKGAQWQKWWLVPLNPKVKAAKTVAPGVYSIARADAGGKLVDVEGASQKDGANVNLWASNGGANQKWVLQRESDDFYRIVSVASGKALDVEGAAMLPGANVLQWKQQGSANQKWAIQKNADGSYRLISALNGMALNVAGKKNGSNVQTWISNGSAGQKFAIKPVALVEPGVYSVGMRSNTNTVVDVPASSTKKGVQLATWAYNGGLNQKYQVRHLGGDVYTLQAGNSGAYVADTGGKVVQAAKNASAKSQRWKAVWRGTGISLVNQATGRALNVAGGSTKGGTALRTAAPTGAASQRFAFTKRNVVDDGMYIIHSATGSRVVDVEGASKADGANALLWKSHGGNNQKFQISAVGQAYKIVNVRSGKALDVEGASKANGANVLQWRYKGSGNQLWRAEIAPQGGVVFVNVNSGKALAVAGGRDADGANVQVGNRSGAQAQRWSLEPTSRKVEDAVLERAQGIADGKSSSTRYLVAVDLGANRTIVFERSGGSWKAVKNWSCSTGAPSTPTVRGDYTVGLRGYSFGSGYTCYYWTQFYGDYLFHSVLYNEGTRTIQDGRLGRSISHGCVRLDIDNAYWIYRNIPSGTKVVTYR